MEGKKRINITNHAVIRYFGRIEKNYILTEKTFEMWKKNHEEELEKAKEEIQLLYDESEFLVQATYGIHKKAECYINKADMITLVVADGVLVTLYEVDFGLDSEGNIEMLEVLYKNLHRLLAEEENWDLQTSAKGAEIMRRLSLLNLEIQEKESVLKLLKDDKKILEDKKSKLSSEGQSLRAKIDNARQKIARSKRSLEV